jgi:toxin secretion/phage lysis holin
MEDAILSFKLAVSAFCAALTALWGWFGWLVIAWIFCMALDYATGSAAALQAGKWSSRAARNGIWHKTGAVVVVIVAALLDMLVRCMISHFEVITLSFQYTIFFCPLVVAWCIITELGSIIENAGALGAPIPSWLVKAIESLGNTIDNSMEGDEKEDGK